MDPRNEFTDYERYCLDEAIATLALLEEHHQYKKMKRRMKRKSEEQAQEGNQKGTKSKNGSKGPVYLDPASGGLSGSYSGKIGVFDKKGLESFVRGGGKLPSEVARHYKVWLKEMGLSLKDVARSSNGVG